MEDGIVLLLGGPAGAGKSTLAAAWCAARGRAVHVELDEVRALIVSGRADPQGPGSKAQREQYALAASACCTLAGLFSREGYDVVVGDVVEPEAFEQDWRPLLEGLRWRLVVVCPSLEETLARSGARGKQVLEQHTRSQHASCLAWPEDVRIDTSGLTVEESLELVERRLQA